MANHTHTPRRYLPPRPIPPGATIRDFLEAAGMSQAELAQRMGRPEPAISEIINAKKSIVEETAIQLERVLGAPAGFWLSLEQSYKESRAREQEQLELGKQTPALRRFPYREMVRRGLFQSVREPTERVLQWLRFLRVSNFEALDCCIETSIAAFARSQSFVLPAEKFAVWMRLGELEFEKLELGSYDPARLREALPEMRRLSREEPVVAVPRLKQLGVECGVAILFVEGFAGLPVYGLTRWRRGFPIIQLSHRQRRLDFVWFALFHEIGHILLHATQRIFIDIDRDGPSELLEEEANRFAADQLIPPMRLQAFVSTERITRETIIDLADELEIHPGIIVGRLRRSEEYIPYSWFNDLRTRFELASERLRSM